MNGKQGERICNMKITGCDFDPNKDYVLASYGGNLQNAGELLDIKPSSCL
ncbi:MAG: hypothetical protein R2865_10100 [Deinococcales bacterium]